jgi:hypothetical protein
MPPQSSALQTSVQPHVHISGQQCPFCEQDIPLDRLEEIRGRIAAREQEWLTAATGGLRNQHARERAQAEAKAEADLEQAQRDAAAAVERLTAEAAVNEAFIRAAATRAAEEAAQLRVEEVSRAQLKETAGFQARLQTPEQAKIAAEERTANVSAELETIRAESAVAIRKVTEEAAEREEAIRADAASVTEAAFHDLVAAAEQARQTAEEQTAHLSAELATIRAESAAAIQKAAEDAAAREETIRSEAARTAETTFQERLAVAEQARNAADSARQTAETELRTRLAETGEQLEILKESHANEINEQREALEKDKIASVNAERAKSLETQMKLEGQLQDMQRQLQKRTADEHGEGAELELYEVLKGAFEDDKIRRVQKGTPGADIVHEVILNGKLCGKIVYDSKNRNRWATEYVTKLRQDQIAEKADHAILSSNKFPAEKKQLHLQEHVIIACPARVLVLAHILRNLIVQMHELRISNEARDDKMAELYNFITSERCGQLLDSIETLIRKLEKIEVDEEKAHRAVWTKRGELLRAVLKANGDLCFAFNRITGTAEAVELQ